MINLLIEVFLVSASSYLFTKRILRIRFLGDFVLVWFILLFAQIVLIELFLGIIGQLYFVNIFFAHLIVFLIASLLLLRKQEAIIIKPDIKPFFSSKLLLLAFSIFTSFFLVKVYINLINPPMCPDSLQYHLAFPAGWIRSGKLNNPFCIFGGKPTLNSMLLDPSAISYYPINAELFFTWLMIPLKNAFLADIGEVPFYFIGIISVAIILRRYGIEKKMALLAGFLWALIPNIFKQLRYGSQIDVICATLFLLVFYTILLLKENFNLKNAILFGISVGLFLGTKVSNIVWFIALVPFFVYVFYRGIKMRRCRLVKVFSLLGIIFFITVLFGGFMYIKNFIFTGNPLFPIDLKIFGKTFFKGLLDNVTYQILIAPGDIFNLVRITFKEGLGVQFVALILPSIFLPFIFYRYIKTKAKPIGEYLILFLIPIIMFLLYRVLINVYIVRYLFPYVTLGLITAVIFINFLPWGKKYFTFISFIAISASASELAHRNELIVSFILSLLLFVTLLLFNKQLFTFFKNRSFNKISLAVLVLAAVCLFYLNDKYNKEEFKRYPFIFSKNESWQMDIAKGWQWLNEQTQDGRRVAYTGRQEFYPFFGSKLKNDVKYISINQKNITPYNAPDGLYRKEKNFQAWLNNLTKERIDYLFVALPFFNNKETEDPDKFPIEDEWASSHPENFQLEFKNSLCHIYRIMGLGSRGN